MDDRNFAALDVVLDRLKRPTVEDMEDEEDLLAFSHVQADELDLEDAPLDGAGLRPSHTANVGYINLDDSDDEI